MLDQREYPGGHEPGRADRLTGTGYLGDLNYSAALGDLDSAPSASGDDVVGAGAVAGVDHDLDPVASHADTLLAFSLRDLETGGPVGTVGPTSRSPTRCGGLPRVVEVPGIEPGSFDDSPGLLRAQPALPLLGSGDHAGKFTVTSPVA
jgi:hypothetical protein